MAQDPTVKDPIARLKERLAQLTGEQAAILQTADAAGRALTAEETAKLKEIETAQASAEEEIERRAAAAEAMAKLVQPEPSKVSAEIPAAKAVAAAAGLPAEHRPPITGKDLPALSPTGGFASGSDWVKAIRTAAIRPDLVDRRLTAMAAQTTYANEGAGPEGGWAMPPEYASGIVEAVAGQASLLGRMKPMQSSSNTYVSPVDESTAWGSTGLQAAKTAEGGSSTVSNVALGNRTVTLYKATAMANVSEELATDNPAVVQHITRIMSRQLQGIVERWILRGTGVGEPLGILNSPALVSVAQESANNGAGTLVRKNLAKMTGRLIPGFDSEAFIVVSPSAKIEVIDLLLGASGNSGTDVQRGYSGGILGYPVVTSMEAAAVGTAGDATAVIPSGFMTLVKGGVNSQATIFFAFDQGLTTLRSYIRLGQVPILSTPVVPKVDTATTLSHCVTTATRT